MANYRKIYEEFYGVKIPKGHHIHHKDFNHSNNDPLNLEMLTADEHAQKHGYLSNFLMAQATASELGAKISSVRNRGNKHNIGRTHPIEQNQAHSRFMMGNQFRKGKKYTRPPEECAAISARQLGKKRGPYKSHKSINQ